MTVKIKIRKMDFIVGRTRSKKSIYITTNTFLNFLLETFQYLISLKLLTMTKNEYKISKITFSHCFSLNKTTINNILSIKLDIKAIHKKFKLNCVTEIGN